MTDKAIAWADDKTLKGSIGIVCSAAVKQFWEKSDFVDRKRAKTLIHPLYASQAAQPDCRTCLYSKHPDNCAVWCTNGDRYIEAPKVVLWRTE